MYIYDSAQTYQFLISLNSTAMGIEDVPRIEVDLWVLRESIRRPWKIIIGKPN
jgi:hypothetical protein